VRFRVISATGLTASDLISGKSDPYVKIVVAGSKEVKTKHIKRELNPVWVSFFSSMR